MERRRQRHEHEHVRTAVAQVIAGERSPADLLGIPPKVVEGLYAIGLDARARGHLELADRSFMRCLSLEPRRAAFWLALAGTRQQRGFPAEAGELYQVAAIVSPEPDAIVFAAVAFAEAGQHRRAASLAETARQRCSRAKYAALAPWFDAVEDLAARSGEVPKEEVA